MRVTVNYGLKSFGNGTTPKRYGVTVRPSGHTLSVKISFDTSVKGQGGFTENTARVRSACLYMSRDHAKTIAEAILKVLGSEDDELLTLQFGGSEQDRAENGAP